jgi:hypothetical protein
MYSYYLYSESSPNISIYFKMGSSISSPYLRSFGKISICGIKAEIEATNANKKGAEYPLHLSR